MGKREMKGFIFLLSSIYAPPTEEDFLHLPPDYLAKFIRLKSAKKHSGPCDDEWLFDGNSKCLKYENPETWQKAVEKCTEMDARLILPENFETQDFLVRTFNRESLWIGGKMMCNGTLDNQFPTDQDGKSLDFVDWQLSYPSSIINERCLILHNEAANKDFSDSKLKEYEHWNGVTFAPGVKNVHCDNRLYFVCVKEIEGLSNRCEAGYKLDRNGLCYQVVSKKKNWDDAKCHCRKQGDNLALLEDSSYEYLLHSENFDDLESSALWIGYDKKVTKDSDFPLWNDVNNNALSYSNWLPTQPSSDKKRTCAQLYNVGTSGPHAQEFSYPAKFVPGWTEQSCQVEQFFICQYDPNIERAQDLKCSGCSEKPTMVFIIMSFLAKFL